MYKREISPLKMKSIPGNLKQTALLILILQEWLLSTIIDSTIEPDDYGMDDYDYSANYDFDLPITTLSSQQNSDSYFLNSYAKPAMGYLYIKDMLGDEQFKKALHYYIQQWHGKHPMPLD